MEDRVENLDDEIVEKGRRLKKLRAEASQLRKEEATLRAEILEAIQDVTAEAEESMEPLRVITASGEPAFTLTPSSRSTFDRDRLQARYPEIYEECIEEKTSITLGIELGD